MTIRRWTWRWAASAWAILVAAVLLAGCGGPAYTYVTNSAERTYLKIPNSWRPIDDSALDAALGLDPTLTDEQRGLWLQAYDADATPSAEHLFGLQTASPITLIAVKDVPASMRGQYSLDKLRDFFVPVSPAGQQQAAMTSSSRGDVTVVSDEVLTPGDGLHGVHVVYRLRYPVGSVQVFDQTAYLNDDASKIYLFFVQCSSECYQQRQKEITAVVSSFTVREKP